MTHGIDSNELFEVSCKVVLLNPARTKALVLIYDDGKYGLPGGHLEKGESIVEAARREIGEELGVNYVDILTQIGFGMHSWAGKNDGILHDKVILGFAGKLNEDTEFKHEPDNPERVTNLEWIAIDDATDKANYYDGYIYADLIKKATEVLE